MNNIVEKFLYETTFENGTKITPYLACAYAEGFCEGESASILDTFRAWSYLIGTKQVYSLQGWYGRNAASLIEKDYIDDKGEINWDNVNDIINIE
jgi:hypothetical protein